MKELPIELINYGRKRVMGMKFKKEKKMIIDQKEMMKLHKKLRKFFDKEEIDKMEQKLICHAHIEFINYSITLLGVKK